MKKNNENKFNEYVLRIGGTLIRTISLISYDWGICVVVMEKTPTKETMLSVHAISVIPRSIRLPSSWFAESRSIIRYTSVSITSHRSIPMTEPTLIGLCLPKWLRFGCGEPRRNSSLAWRTGVMTAKTM